MNEHTSKVYTEEDVVVDKKNNKLIKKIISWALEYTELKDQQMSTLQI